MMHIEITRGCCNNYVQISYAIRLIILENGKYYLSKNTDTYVQSTKEVVDQLTNVSVKSNYH